MNPNDLQPFLDVAISVLERRDVIAAEKLKDFLMASPGPTYTEQALGLAVVYFVENDPSVFDWILSNQDILSPELDLKSFIRKMIYQRLVSCGWIDGENFVIESDRLLIAGPEFMTKFDCCFSKGEMTLVKLSFHIDSLSST